MVEIGYGTKLQRVTSDGTTAPPTYTAIANIFDVAGPAVSRTDVDVTDYDSTDRYREYIPGLREGGEITAMLNLVSTALGLQQLYHSTAAQSTAGPTSAASSDAGAFESNTIQPYRILGPNDDFWRFSGYVKGITQAQPIDDKRTWEVTFKITGRPYMGHTS